MAADDGIPIQHIPLRVQNEIAKYLDIGTEHTWESLAECMGLDVVTIMCIKSRSHQQGYARCLLERYGSRVTVEQLIHWLNEIGNLPARDALQREYDGIKNTYQQYLDKIRHHNALSKPESPAVAGQKERKPTIFLLCSDDGLRQCLQIHRWLLRNGFSVVFYAEDIKDLLSWTESQVKQAKFVLFVISDGFCQDVQSSSAALNGVHHAVTHYAYEMMHSEYVRQSCCHNRCIPVLLPSTNFDNVPPWLKSTNIYLWPEHYEKLFQVFYNCSEQLQCK